MEWVLVYLGLAVVVGVAANTRGRSGLGWFLLALLISPLISGLLALALPRVGRLATPQQTDRLFEPEGVLRGFPYRLLQNGTVEAMMTGGLVHFRTMELFRAAAEGRDVVQTKPLAPAPSTTYRGYTYFARENGIELKLKHGGTKQFPSEEGVVAYIDAITGNVSR
jgi:hypothetical protein